MAKFFGQERLRAKLDGYTLANLPKSIMLLGEEGCGKKTLVRMLANRLGIDLVTIKARDSILDKEDNLIDELTEYSRYPVNRLYLIDLCSSLRTDKFYHAILKFIEEPSNTVNIVIIAETEAGILPTILNRCIKYRFDDYSTDELRHSAWCLDNFDDYVYKVFKTPGKLVNLSAASVNALHKTCLDIIKFAKTMQYPNAINISNLINYKDNYDKYDLDQFLDMLMYVAFEDYKNTGNETSLTVYLTTNRFKQAKINKSVVKEQFMLNFLTQLYKETH